jgi:hypothetical protein
MRCESGSALLGDIWLRAWAAVTRHACRTSSKWHGSIGATDRGRAIGRLTGIVFLIAMLALKASVFVPILLTKQHLGIGGQYSNVIGDAQG